MRFEFYKTRGDGLNLFFQSWESGRPAKAVVCLMHGLGEHSGRYAHVAEALNRGGYHLMALDLPGHGKSGGKRGDLPAYDGLGEDVSLLLVEALKRYPTIPQILYGHSLGATLVLYHCLRFKPTLAGVVATGPGLMTALQEQKGKIALAKLLGSLLPGVTIASGLDVTSLSRDPAVIERYIKDPLVHNRATLGFAVNSMSAISYIYENAKAWELPLLIMHGTADRLTYPRGSELFAEMVRPGICTLRLWEGLFHELHNEPEKEEVFAYLISQLDKITA